LVTVHLAGLPSNLVESELFGHEKGAFTGADKLRIGRVEQAEGGTLFLDEIGEIDAALQVKLLRLLGESREFERLGSNKKMTADVRLLAATNKNLAQLVKAGTFREDLYFRLRVVEIWLPPLRERASDIPLLTGAFLKEFAKEHGKAVNEMSAPALQALMTYPWPGNVRELRSEIERAVVLSQKDKIELSDLSPTLRAGGSLSVETDPRPVPKQDGLTKQETEKQLILRALREARGNRTLAAKRIGISRRTFHRKLHLYNLEKS
jgi:DNA-binding NtrC family response regulator